MSEASLDRLQKRLAHTVSFRNTGAVAPTKANNSATASTSDAHCTPASVHTHTRMRVQPIETFAEMLDRQPLLSENTIGPGAYSMSDYCEQARRMMERVIRLLESIEAGSSMAQLTLEERTKLRNLRALWSEHLRANFYNLIGSPPNSGGQTARYSLGVQLWLLVAHANVILQQSDAAGALFDFYPPGSNYLSRNRLIVDNARVMNYPLRTFLLALEHFVCSLDAIDRFHVDYNKYAAALEHRASELVCHTGTKDEYNAPEWCVASEAGQGERVSEEFITHVVCWFVNIYNYGENWCALTSKAILNRLTNQREIEHICLPAHEVAVADWAPSARTMRRLTAFLCDYAFGLKEALYTSKLREFLLKFDIRPGDMDVYRSWMRTDQPHVQSVIQHEFRGSSLVARTYLRKLHHDRTPYSYLVEVLQWVSGDETHTRSASLSRLGFTRQLVVLYIFHQYIEGRFKFEFSTFMYLFQRDPAFITTLQRAIGFKYPIIVQKGARFGVFVPHRRPPEEEIRRVLHWRACARARRKNLPPPAPLAQAPASVGVDDDGQSKPQFVRVYECMTSMQALAVWALWTMHMTRGHVDSKTPLGDFILDVFGWR